MGGWLDGWLELVPGIGLGHEVGLLYAVRNWCYRFGLHFC